MRSVYNGEWAHFDEEVVMRGRHSGTGKILSQFERKLIWVIRGLKNRSYRRLSKVKIGAEGNEVVAVRCTLPLQRSVSLLFGLCCSSELRTHPCPRERFTIFHRGLTRKESRDLIS